MILSVSRRTDIPALYPEWFMNRIREGYALVRNPMNFHQVSRVPLGRDALDCIIFWTKNALPMLPYLDEISAKYPFYFQYTLNAYGQEVEPHLPDMERKLYTFRRLSEKISEERIIWRYDPIFLTDAYNLSWHIERFAEIAASLKGYTRTCVFSFIDIYDKVKNNVKSLHLRPCGMGEMNALAKAFAAIAFEKGMTLQTCSEEVDLDQYGIRHGSCIDGALIAKLIGYELVAKKDKNQRDVCGCLESVDIGQYNTCRHGCRYCYANFNPQSVATFSKQHDPASPLLIGNLDVADKVTDRKVKSLKGQSIIQMEIPLL